jgi:histidinol phosphatase-like enzyme (inositol monophosphatase family)
MTLGAKQLEELFVVAQELARGAGLVTMEHFGSMVTADSKKDGTPVTVADRAAETYLRDRIEQRFPEHGILGEEFGETNPGASVRWILDPIDGTASFMRGVPLFGVLIGVEIEGEASVGVVHIPALQETVAAASGFGCFWNGSPARVSSVTDLSRATVLSTDPAALLDGSDAGAWARLVKKAALARMWGDCYGHILVATGRADVMFDPTLFPWDAAPLVAILKEAGGLFTDHRGVPGAHGGSGISTNGLLHQEVLDLIRGDRGDTPG